LWSVITVFLMFAAFALTGKAVARRWHFNAEPIDPALPWKIAALSALLMADKLHQIFTLGQSDGLMLLGFALVLHWLDRKPVLAGIAAGAAANIKYLSLIFVPYFLFKRNFRAAFSACVSFAFFLALPMVSTGITRGLDYALVALGGIGRILGRPAPNIRIIEVTWDHSVSVTSTMLRATRALHSPDSVALVLILLIFGALLAGIVFLSRRARVPLFGVSQVNDETVAPAIRTLEWAILVVLADIFSPQATPRHLVLIALVYSVALAIFFTARESRFRKIVAAALALMVFGLCFPSRGTPLDFVMKHWRSIGGPSWCAIVLVLVLTFAGSRVIAARSSQRKEP
ncbi:MAG: DUF2029 domain-containing protein, partial [Verrucomicrobiota bacterium]|nr:DUF2029 domain-containing protein [Verrucomicrobiota bacterium]